MKSNHLRQEIEKEGRVEGDLRKEIQMNIRRLIEIQAYRGESGTAAICRCAASGRIPMRVPARVRGAARSRPRKKVLGKKG